MLSMIPRFYRLLSYAKKKNKKFYEKYKFDFIGNIHFVHWMIKQQQEDDDTTLEYKHSFKLTTCYVFLFMSLTIFTYVLDYIFL